MEFSFAEMALVTMASLAVGFAAGYGLRAYKSYRRRLRQGMWARERLI